MRQRTRFEASLGPVPTTGSSTRAQLNRAFNQTSANVACVFGELFVFLHVFLQRGITGMKASCVHAVRSDNRGTMAFKCHDPPKSPTSEGRARLNQDRARDLL